MRIRKRALELGAFAFGLAAVAFLFTVLVAAQSFAAPGPGGFYSLGGIAGTGQLGAALNFSQQFSAPANYTLDWSYAGTAPTACTLQAEGSSDAVHWYSLTGSQDCTTATMIHVASKPVLYLRINVLTYTAGDGTTAVSVRYTRGTN